MKCPIDVEVDLLITDRSGIEIDYCPKCRGVWLDRGELDKLIERAGSPPVAPAAPPAAAPAAPPPPPMRWDSSPDYGYGQKGYGYGKKRKSLLSEIFDF